MTSSFWRDRRVLVTGGAGFIGSGLAPRLVELGAKVRIVDNLERGHTRLLGEALPAVQFIEGDLRLAAACREAVNGIDTVFHLASKVGGIGFYRERCGEVMLQNVLIDANVLAAAKEARVARYVYASSAHVYPKDLQQTPDAAPLRETDALPANPELSYGWAKYLGEKEIEYLAAEGTGPRAAILRLVGAYGGNQSLELATGSAIPVFTTRAILYPQVSFVMWGTGRETRSYCFVDDVVAGLLAAAEATDRFALVGPLNLGAEGRISIEELARMIIKISGKDVPIIRDQSKPTSVWGQAVDCSLAHHALNGWRPMVSLDEGLHRTYAAIEARLRRRAPEIHRDRAAGE